MKTNTLHLSSPKGAHPNLLSLRAALTTAKSAVPARPPRVDINEQRALQLIARMQAKYKRITPFLDSQDIPSPQGSGARLNLHEMAGTHAR